MDNRYTETFKTWNKLALEYQEKFMDLDLYNETYDFICSSIQKKGAKLLEIGCGPGNITRYLLSKRPDFDIFGIDIAPNMIELARSNNPAAWFAIMDFRQIETLTTQYDAIVCGFCLPFIAHNDSQKLIADACNLLYEGGLMYISFVEGDPDASGFKETGSGDRTYFYYYRLDGLSETLQKNGFERIHVFNVKFKRGENEFDTHTILSAFKKQAQIRE